MMKFTTPESAQSHTPMKSASITRDTITITVDPMSSSRFGHETLIISSLISLKKFATLFAILHYRIPIAFGIVLLCVIRYFGG